MSGWMNEQQPPERIRTLNDTRQLYTQHTPLEALAELFDFRHLLLDGLLHPIEAFNAYIPHFKMPKFNPATDIPSLAGKVILVTGG